MNTESYMLSKPYETPFIFLDFDGVLHTQNDNDIFFGNLDYFQDVIEKYDVKIVFSTSWRESFPHDVLVDFFKPSIQKKIHGSTSIHKNNLEKESRYLEIMDYVNQFNIKYWIAIDDMPNLFPINCQNLILCESSIGFGIKEAKQLKNFLENTTIKNLNLAVQYNKNDTENSVIFIFKAKLTYCSS